MKPDLAALTLKELKNKAYQYYVTDLCSVILDDPKFLIWSGSSNMSQHHYGKHGLIIHTWEVVSLCNKNNEFFTYEIDARQLFLAALFHDAGKMWDYEPIKNEYDVEMNSYDRWQGTKHKRHIHHISRSALVWQEAAIKNPTDWLTQEYIDDVLHAILAHHGLREWGSPVSPNTKLAWMLHLCDGISARMEDAGRWEDSKKK